MFLASWNFQHRAQIQPILSFLLFTRIVKNFFCCRNVWVRYPYYLTIAAAKSSVTYLLLPARLQERVGSFSVVSNGEKGASGPHSN